MSQSQSSLRKKVQRKFGQVKQNGEGEDWLRDLVESLVQELLEVEFAEQLPLVDDFRTLEWPKAGELEALYVP